MDDHLTRTSTVRKDTLRALELVDALCDKFESEWRDGGGPQIESYLSSVGSEHQEVVLFELLQIELQLRQPIELESLRNELSRRFPEFPTVVSQVCEHLERSDFSTIRIEFPGHQKFFATSDSTTTTSEKSSLFGDELLDQLGRGGMGVVYRARHLATRRIVALKVILIGKFSDDASREGAIRRFQQEATSAARIQHENVVTVYDAGVFNDTNYFSMRLIEGENLAAKVGRGPIATKDAARYVADAARGVQAAHEAGVLHRDIKPHNILVERHSDKALIADFGLAKCFENHEQTGSGDVFGSPNYMAPEQATAARSVTAATDVYGLGATLYHLITGRPPFQAASALETLSQLTTREPLAPRSINPSIDKDLDTLVLKCLEKDPSRRFSRCKDLVDELDRYLEGRPILSRPIASTQKLIRWTLRNRTLAVLLVMAVASLVLGTVFSTAYAIRSLRATELWRQEALRADGLTKLAEQRRETAERALYESLASTGTLLCEQRSYVGWSWDAERQFEQANNVRRHDSDPRSIRNGLLRCWTADDLLPVAKVAVGIHASAIAYSRDGKLFAVGQQKSNLPLVVQVFDTTDWSLKLDLRTKAFPEIPNFFDHIEGITDVQFSNDNRWLFASTRKGYIAAWDLFSSKTKQYYWKAFDARIDSLFVELGNDCVAVNSNSKSGHQFECFQFTGGNWSKRDTRLPSEGLVSLSLAGGSPLCVSSVNGLSWYSDPQSPPLRHDSHFAGRRVAMHPSGRFVVSSSDSELIIADVQSEMVTAKYMVSQDTGSRFSFSCDGSRIAVSGDQPEVKIVDLSTGKISNSLPTPDGRIEPVVEFSPVAPLLAMSGNDHVQIFQHRHPKFCKSIGPTEGKIEDVALDEEQGTVITASRMNLNSQTDYQIGIWDTATGQLMTKYHLLGSPTNDDTPMRMYLDAQQLVVAIAHVGLYKLSVGGQASETDLTSERMSQLIHLNHSERVIAAGQSSLSASSFNAGRIVHSNHHQATIFQDSSESLLQLRNGASTAEPFFDNQASTITTGVSDLTALACSGRWIVVGTKDGRIFASSMQDFNEPISALVSKSRSQIQAVATDDQWAAVGDQSGKVTILKLADMKERAEIEAFEEGISDVAISNGANVLVAGSQSGVLRIWHRQPNMAFQDSIKLSLNRPIVKTIVDSNGAQIVVQSRDCKSVILWDLRSLSGEYHESTGTSLGNSIP